MFKNIKKLLLTILSFSFLFFSVQAMRLVGPKFELCPESDFCRVSGDSDSDREGWEEIIMASLQAGKLDRLDNSSDFECKCNETESDIEKEQTGALQDPLESDFLSKLNGQSTDTEEDGDLYADAYGDYICDRSDSFENSDNSELEAECEESNIGFETMTAYFSEHEEEIIQIQRKLRRYLKSIKLIKAAFSGKYIHVKYYLDSGVYPDSQDNNGNTALHKAVLSPHLDWVKTVWILLKYDADPRIENNLEERPLELILKRLNKVVLKIFLTQNVKQNISQYRGYKNSISDISSYLGAFEMIYFILDKENCLQKLVSADFLYGILENNFEEDVVFGQDFFDRVTSALINYPKTFASLSNKYEILPERINIDYLDNSIFRKHLERFYTLQG